jgi:hypothetical protein
MENFIKEKCVSGLCALERGGTLSRFYLQMVCKIYIFNLVVLSKFSFYF